MNEYEEAVNLMNQYKDWQRFAGPRPESLIYKAERRLNLLFPPSYRRFLLEYGAGYFGSQDFHGVIGENFDESGSPDAIWETIQLRNQFALPNELVFVRNGGGIGFDYFIHVGVGTNENAPIVTYIAPVNASKQEPMVIASDFSDFLLEAVQKEIEWNTK